MTQLPDGLISYGPDANCTLQICPVEWSVVGYLPSLAANWTFLGLFALSLLVHVVQGFAFREWGFMACMVLGCADEILGYVGRIMLHDNPFSFNAFLMEIICITTAPVFFCAAIYVTLSRTINHLDASLSRFSPALLYWVFIPFDLISLALQAGGGATSSDSTGSNQTGVDVSLVGLSLQVATLFIFIVLGADYLFRYARSAADTKRPMGWKFVGFVCFLTLAVLLILARCCYRIDELSAGYSSSTFTNESLFIGLEGVLVSTSVFALNIGHPGFVLRDRRRSYDDDIPMDGKNFSHHPQASLGDDLVGSAIA